MKHIYPEITRPDRRLDCKPFQTVIVHYLPKDAVSQDMGVLGVCIGAGGECYRCLISYRECEQRGVSFNCRSFTNRCCAVYALEDQL